MTGVTLVETKDWLALKQELADMKEMLHTLLHGAEKKDPAYSLHQAASIMNRHYNWVFANKHKIGCSRVGRNWVIKQSSIESFINQSYHKDA